MHIIISNGFEQLYLHFFSEKDQILVEDLLIGVAENSVSSSSFTHNTFQLRFVVQCISFKKTSFGISWISILYQYSPNLHPLSWPEHSGSDNHSDTFKDLMRNSRYFQHGVSGIFFSHRVNQTVQSYLQGLFIFLNFQIKSLGEQ